MTWDYSYLAFATFMIKQESGISDIERKSPANESKGFEERYDWYVKGLNSIVDDLELENKDGADAVNLNVLSNIGWREL